MCKRETECTFKQGKLTSPFNNQHSCVLFLFLYILMLLTCSVACGFSASTSMVNDKCWWWKSRLSNDFFIFLCSLVIYTKIRTGYCSCNLSRHFIRFHPTKFSVNVLSEGSTFSLLKLYKEVVNKINIKNRENSLE